MKISVLGAGAIGSMLGGLIKHHAPDLDVVLIMRGDHGQKVDEQGAVRLQGPWGSRDVPIAVSFDVSDIAGSDFVLLTVKSQSTEEAIRSAVPHLGNAIVISIQNGINHETLLQHVSPGRLVMGMTATNMAVLEPGSVSLQLDGPSVVGPVPGHADITPAAQAASVLQKTALRFDEHPNVLGVQYNKLAINALGYASCMSASNFITDAVCNRSWRHHVGRPIIDECVRAYEKAGIELARIPGRPDMEKIQGFLRLLDKPVLGALVGFGAERIYNRKPIVFSLYQDLKRQKKTEVEHINGAIVRLAKSHGIEAPYNAKVVEMVHRLEKRDGGGFFVRDEVVEEFERHQE